MDDYVPKTYIRGAVDPSGIELDFYQNWPITISEIINELNAMAESGEEFPNLGSCLALLTVRLNQKHGTQTYFNGVEVI